MRLFYCPKCKKEEIRTDDPYKNKHTINNMRDGYGRPITHYKCACGNYLAGSMDVNGWINDENAILYCKETIEGYNPGGCYYNFNMSINGETIDMNERAKFYYKERKLKELEHDCERLWLKLCCFYHAKTELFDRRLTNLRSPHDPTEAYIISNSERSRSSAYAIKVRERIKHLARQLNVPEYIIKSGVNPKRFSHISAQGWIDMYEHLVENGEMNFMDINEEGKEDLC